MAGHRALDAGIEVRVLAWEQRKDVDGAGSNQAEGTQADLLEPARLGKLAKPPHSDCGDSRGSTPRPGTQRVVAQLGSAPRSGTRRPRRSTLLLTATRRQVCRVRPLRVGAPVALDGLISRARWVRLPHPQRRRSGVRHPPRVRTESWWSWCTGPCTSGCGPEGPGSTPGDHPTHACPRILSGASMPLWRPWWSGPLAKRVNLRFDSGQRLASSHPLWTLVEVSSRDPRRCRTAAHPLAIRRGRRGPAGWYRGFGPCARVLARPVRRSDHRR
jgi:hypothetical protein